jgi:hypothetical protein
MQEMYEAVDGAGTDEATLVKVAKTLTPEEKCYICRRPAFADGSSLLNHIESDLDYYDYYGADFAGVNDVDMQLALDLIGAFGCEWWFGMKTWYGSYDDWFGQVSDNTLALAKKQVPPNAACGTPENPAPNCGSQFWSAADCKEVEGAFGVGGGDAKAKKGDYY